LNKPTLKILTNPKLSENIYNLYMAHLQVLPVVSIVTTGRTGSDFLQSLFDDHKEILTFNGHFAVYSEYFNVSKIINNDKAVAKDIVEEMVGFYLYKLVSKYEIQERKDKLGESYNESFEVDTDTFKLHMLGLLNNVELNTRNILLAFYGAYGINLNHNLLDKKVFIHHPHLDFEFNLFYKDFKDGRLIFTSRDPRANFCSHVEHFRKYYKSHDNQHHLYNCLEMILSHSKIAEEKGLDFITTRLEDLPREDYMRALADWLKIEFEESLLRSTWAGLDWHGDRISEKEFPSSGWTPDRTSNGWEKRLGKSDKYILNFILNESLSKFGYQFRKTNFLDIVFVFFLILLPSKYERRFFSLSHFKYMFVSGSRKNRIQYLLNPIYYFKRIALLLDYFCKRIFGVSTEPRLIGRDIGR
tara:strand:- start:379 stop:1620 length:1242 start_codon:yes stop_codon:yes gene_type:complete